MTLALPPTLTINAFTGEDIEVASPVVGDANRWGSIGTMLGKQAPLAPAGAVNLADWTDERVGWGVVLPENEALSDAEKARGVDAPPPIADLIRQRGSAPVLRYRSDLGVAKLARYFTNRSRQDPLIGLSQFGIAPGRIPLYLLIVGSPEEIPWSLQYSLNRRHHVGRLDLDANGLANYVAALQSDWQGMHTDPSKPVVWSVDYDSITRKMDRTIAQLITAAMGSDNELADSMIRIPGSDASHTKLIEALRVNQPAVIVTSSHGKTGPLDNAALMRATLGLPVDRQRSTLDIDLLLAEWKPNGAIWYAQACCSAGSDGGTSYAELLKEGSMAAQVVEAVGQLGPGTAPLPKRLLGLSRPLRAFVGHVEPTFDWTLIESETGQFLTMPLVDAVYPNVYRRCNVGMSLDSHYRGVGELYSHLAAARKAVDRFDDGARDAATYYRLTACDRQSLVILGDPTVVMPPLPSQVGLPHPPVGCGNQ